MEPCVGGTFQISLLTIAHAGIPEAFPLEMGHIGWQQSLAQLATPVMPDVFG